MAPESVGDAAAEELYQLPLAEFVRRRGEQGIRPIALVQRPDLEGVLAVQVDPHVAAAHKLYSGYMSEDQITNQLMHTPRTAVGAMNALGETLGRLPLYSMSMKSDPP